MSIPVFSALLDILMITAQQFVGAWFTAKFIRTDKSGLFCFLYTAISGLAYAYRDLVNPSARWVVMIVICVSTFALVLIFTRRSRIRSMLFTVVHYVCTPAIDYLIMLLYIALLPHYSENILAASLTTETPFQSLSLSLIFLFRVTGIAETLASVLIAYYSLRGKAAADDSTDRSMNRFVPVLLFELAFSAVLMVFTSRVALENISIVWVMIAVLGMFYVLDLLLWNILRTVENNEKLRHDKEKTELLAEANAAAYKQLKESSIQFRTLRHDMLNQLQTASVLLKNGDLDALSGQLDAYSEKIHASSCTVTGNGLVDAILSMKQSVCRNEGIELTVSGKLPETTPLDQAELCSVVSNILDNAIHAVQKQKADGSECTIRFSADIRDDKLVISCRNAFDSLPEAGNESPNADKEHGWGLLILKKTAKDHGGEFTLAEDNGSALAVFWIPYQKSGSVDK